MTLISEPVFVPDYRPVAFSGNSARRLEARTPEGTALKIQSFPNLPKKWHSGDDGPISKRAINGSLVCDRSLTDTAGKIRVRLAADGHKPYPEAVEGAFGTDIDCAMLIKHFRNAPGSAGCHSSAICIGAKQWRVEGCPDEDQISTSYAPGHAPVRRADQWIQQESRKPLRCAGAVLCALQLRAHPQDTALHTSHDGWRDRSPVQH